MRPLIRTALACLLAVLLAVQPVTATISAPTETTTTAATHWSDGTQTLAWSSAPTSGDLAVVCGLMLTIAVTFVTPTATNVTFSSVASSTVDSTADATVQCWSGVATGTVGDVTLTTSATTGAAGTMRLLRITSTTGWTAPGGATPCQESGLGVTNHDAGCSGLTTAAGTNSIIVALTGITAAGQAITLDATYTALTGIAQQMGFGYYITTGQETQDFVSTTGAARDSATIQMAFDEDAGGGGGSMNPGGLGTLGVGR